MSLNHSANTYFDIALAKSSVVERCRELTKLIDDCGSKVLHNNFVTIIHHIFGVNRVGWGVLTANPRHQAGEYNAMIEFLGCRGAMFRLLQKLQTESMLFRYDFPCSLLPPNFIHLPGEHSTAATRMYSAAATFNASQLGPSQFSPSQNLPSGQPCLRISAFEFYFYHFANCMVRSPSPHHPPMTLYSYHQLPPSAEENLYYRLVEEYLSYFLPLDGAALQTMHIPATYTQAGAGFLHLPVNSLLRKASVKPTPPLGGPRNEMWRSDLIVHILVEFWLGYCVIRRDQKHTVAPPSEDLIRAIRQLVKHIHYFNNATNSSLNNSRYNDTSMDVFKQNILYNSLQPRLFSFLAYCFKVWPLNSSFRVVLETWLSYIQPWRYSDTEVRLSVDREIANVWYHFINSNLSFYNQLFYNAINRFLRMDISKQANSLLLYRVAKIFDQPNLFQMIEEAEIAMYGTEKQSMFSFPAGGSFTVLSRYDASASPPPCLITSEEMRRTVNQLLIVCKQALGTVKRYTAPHKVDFSIKVLNMIGLQALTDVGSDTSLNTNWKKSKQQIEDSMQMLASMFDLSLADLNMNPHEHKHLENPFGPDAPDIAFDEEGKAVLSDLGRYEVVNNIKKLPIYPNSYPEMQPIRTFENTFLVRFLHRISTSVNAKYGSKMEELCAERNVVGHLAKSFLRPAYDSSPSVKVKNWQMRKAHFSLRVFAHYRTLFYMFVYFMLCRLIGVSCLKGSCVAFLFFIVFWVLKAIVHVHFYVNDD